MPIFNFSVVEYEHDRPWAIRATHTGSVELDRATDFSSWAAVAWPGDRFKATLDSFQGPRFSA